MKLIILYGAGLVGLNNKLISLKKEFSSFPLTEIKGSEVSLQKLILELSSQDLFSKGRLVILEDPQEDLDLEKLPLTDDLILVVKINKNLAANSKFLKSAQIIKGQILFFPEEKELSIFPFLDSLAEKSPKAYIELEKLQKEYGSQYIITMIYYLLRRLLVPPKNLPLWSAKKLEKQRLIFSLEKVKNFYRQVLELDYKIKVGLIEEKIALIKLTNKFLFTGSFE